MIAVGATTIIHRAFDAAARRRRDRAVARDRRVDRARDGARDPRRTRRRGARSLVGARDHRRRREDADPVHRAPAHDVPVGVVRRRVRPDRDGVGRHVPRPRQHVVEARKRRPAVPVPRARHLGRARRVGARRANAARSCCAARRCSRATGAIPTRRAPRSPAAGSTPATSACATTTGTSTSSIGSRT